MHEGRVVFGAMDEVVFGRPAAAAIVAQMDRLGARRAFLMVSGTLNRETPRSRKSARRSARVAPPPSMRCRRTPRAKP